MVTHTVIHELEVIKIEEENREESVAITARAQRGVGQSLQEERPVGKAGQRIMQRVVAKLALSRFAFGERVAQL